MGKYNSVKAAPTRAAKSPLKTVPGAAKTHTGGVGYVNDAKTELYRLGVNLFAGGEETYHEGSGSRDSRFGTLVEQLANEDPKWTLGFLIWLRSEGNIRTASVLGAMHAIHARQRSGYDIAGGSKERGYNRQFAGLIPQRLDEIGEEFAIWQANFGKPFPQPLKRGAGDALKRLANEYSVMKYDTDSHSWRIADVLGVAHVTPADEAQSQLFQMAIAQRYGNEYGVGLLPMVEENIRLRRDVAKTPKVLLDASRLKAAGFTWEDALSLAGNKVPKDQLWNALILGGSVGYMAMLRNLRNFEQAGISAEATQYVIHRLSDPQAVAKSRQFPFRFWSAYKNAQGTQWVHALETALQLSTANIPELSGSTLVLIDTSGSMSATLSNKSTIRRDEAAAVFGAALAARNAGKVDLHMFADRHARVKVTKGGSVLRVINDVTRRNGEVGYGTETVKAVKDLFDGHDRVMIFTDGQSFPNTRGYSSDSMGYYVGQTRLTIDSVVPKGKFVYAWDLAGYKHMDIPSGEGTRHQLAGLTDGTFKAIPLLERGRSAKWPWEN